MLVFWLVLGGGGGLVAVRDRVKWFLWLELKQSFPDISRLCAVIEGRTARVRQHCLSDSSCFVFVVCLCCLFVCYCCCCFLLVAARHRVKWL